MEFEMTSLNPQMMIPKNYNLLKINFSRAMIAYPIYLYYKFVSTQKSIWSNSEGLPIVTNPHFCSH